MRPVLGTEKQYIFAPAARISKVCIEALTVSVTYSVLSFATPHCSVQDASLKTVPTVGMVDRAYIPRTGVRVRSLPLPWSSSGQGSIGGHVFSMTSSNIPPPSN